MTPLPAPPVDDSPALRFLERIRKSFSHDLRTPLGVIVNYAAVLEASQEVDAAEVRDLALRIRDNAQRIARMLQVIVQATTLAGQPLRATPTDLAALARSSLDESGGRGAVRLASPTQQPVVDLDAEVVGFAWRAFLGLACSAPGERVEIEIGARAEEAGLQLDLRASARASEGMHLAREGTGEAGEAGEDTTELELSAFLRQRGGGPARLEAGLGLGLARELLSTHGGDLVVWGRTAGPTGIRVHLPASV